MKTKMTRSKFYHRRRLALIDAILIGCLFVFLLSVQARPVFGQDDDLIPDTLIVDESSVFVQPPREILRPLIRAQKAIDEGDFQRAVDLLGQALSDEEYEDYLVRLAGEEGTAVSLRIRATALLGRIPKKERELYELRYGVQARQMLDDAINRNDDPAMARIMERFFYTPAGFNATMLCGHHHLQQGRPVAAAFCFQRIADTPDARSLYDPEVSVLLATCWILNGANKRAEAVLRELKATSQSDLPGASSVVFQGRDVPLFRDNEDPVAWLRKLIGDSPLAGNALVQDWVMFRGNPQRNANSGTGLPLISPRWSLPTLNDPEFEKLIVSAREQLVLDGSSTIPGVQPLAIGDTVIMRTFDRMIGVDLNTGKREWVYPPFDRETFFKAEEVSATHAASNMDAVCQRMWMDAVFGQISSDASRIYVVPQPGFAGTSRTRTVLRGGTVVEDPMGQRSVNELTAVDLNREGEFRWHVGGESGLDEPALAGAFFLGPPLPLDRILFAIVEQESEIRLVCLESESGGLLWSQQLASVEKAGPVSTNYDRRLAGATPSFSDGLIICPTGVGALVAVDISTRSLVWGYQYNSAQNQSAGRIDPSGNSRTGNSPHDNAWQDSTVTIAGGSVLFTPIDKQELIVLDLLSGKPKWIDDEGLPIAGIPRNDSLYVGCVTNGSILLIGSSTVCAVELDSGTELWSVEPGLLNPETVGAGPVGKPAGRGYSDDHYYYLPTTGERLLKISLESGRVEKAIRTRGVLGNLICHKGYVVSHGVDHVAVFPQDEPNRRLIANAEERGDLNAAQKTIKAQLLIQDGALREAAATLSEAYDEQPGYAREELLAGVSVQLLESDVAEDFSAGMQLALRYTDRFNGPERGRFLAAKVDGLIRNRQWQLALDELMAINNGETASRIDDEILIETNGLRDFDSSVAATENVDLSDSVNNIASKVHMAFSAWRYDRLSHVIAAANDAGSDLDELAMRERISDLFAAASRSRTPIDRFHIARSMGLSSLPVEFGVAMTGSLLNDGERLAASIMIEYLDRDHSLPPDTMGELYSRLAELEQADAARLKAIVSQTGVLWNRGRVNTEVVPFSTDARDDYEYRFSRNELTLKTTTDPAIEQFLFRYFSTTGELEVIDRFGRAFSKIGLRDPSQHAYANLNAAYGGEVQYLDGLLSVRLGTELFLLDWFKVLSRHDPVLWSIDLRKGNPNAVSEFLVKPNIWGEHEKIMRGIPFSLTSRERVCYIAGSKLVCVDALNGREFWQRGPFPRHARILGDGDTVVVWDSQKRSVRVFDSDSGAETGAGRLGPEYGTLLCSTGTRMLLSTVRYVPDLEGDAGPENGSGDERDSDDDESSTEGTGSGADIDEPEKEEPDEEKVMRLFDLLNGEMIWERSYDSKAVAAMIRNEQVLVIDGASELQILDIATGEVLSSAPTGLPIELATGKPVVPVNIEIRPMENDFLVKLHTAAATTTRYTTIDNTEIRYLNYGRPFWNGYTLAVNRETGAPRWTRPARTQYFQYAGNLPWSSPVTILLRRLNRRGVPSTRRYWTQLVAIDLQTGRLAVNSMTELSQSSDYRIEIDPETQVLDFFFPTKKMSLSITDRPVPPSPIAHLTGENSIEFEQVPVFKPVIDREANALQRAELIERIRERELELDERREEMRQIMEQQGAGG